MNVPTDLLYTKTHEWIRFLGDTARIGVTDYAQKELGDVVFIDLPNEGDAILQGKPFADVESVKATSEIFSPLSGTISAVNDTLSDAPEQINEHPYDAWLIEVASITARAELLSPDEYAKHLENAE